MEFEETAIKAAEKKIAGILGGDGKGMVEALIMLIRGSSWIRSDALPQHYKVMNLSISSTTGRFVIEYEEVKNEIRTTDIETTVRE